MIRAEHPRLTSAIVSLGVGLLLLAITPKIAVLEQADRKWFGFLSGKAHAVAGVGSREDPRRTEEIGVPQEVPPTGILRLEEDPDQFFEESPPVPTDLAVVMARLRAMEVEHLGIGYPLGWEDPDTLAIEAMRATMDRMESVVLGFQLNNATVGEPVPVPFQRCSIAYAEVGGDRSKLPVVNRLPGELPEFGGEETKAGFTLLGSEEQESRRAYLLARWDDRVVFSLPVVMAISQLGVPLDHVEVEVGNQIRLGPDGPQIDIDFRGRIRLPDESKEVIEAPATAMISRSLPNGFGAGGAPVYLIDARLGSSKFLREWGESLAQVDGVVRHAPRRMGSQPVSRPGPLIELLALVAVALMGSWWLRGASVVTRLGKAVIVVGVVAVLLSLIIRLAGLAPVPLAFQMVPVTALLMVLFIESSGKVEVVRASPKDGENASEPKPAPRRKSGTKKRRKR